MKEAVNWCNSQWLLQKALSKCFYVDFIVNMACCQQKDLDSKDTIWAKSTKILPFIDSLFFQPLVSLVLSSGRKSLHQFDNPEEGTLPLIYNYTPVYTANFTKYEQVYFF